jgi:hypothetical protein
MTLRLPIAFFLVIALSYCCAQTPIDVQPVKELDRGTNLATCDYRPAPKEAPFYKRLSASEQATGSTTAEYSIRDKQGRYVSWLGVVRGVVAAKPGASTLLLEQKAFDGLTDCHIMLVSFAGSGDFRAAFVPGRETIQPLSLVRVYGRVTGEIDGIPEVSTEYLRVWPLMTFTFTDLGPKNSGNPEWTRLCQLCKSGGRVYNPLPNRQYYTLTLGEPQAQTVAPVISQPNTHPPVGGARGLVRYELNDPPLFLFKPESWTVTPGHTQSQLRVRVAEPGGAARVDAIYSDNRAARLNSLTLLATFVRQMKQKDPTLQLSEVMACKDEAVSCAVATVAYRVDGVPVKGRYFFHADANQAIIRGYLAPAAELAAKRTLLLDVLTNIHLLPSSATQGVPSQPPLEVQFAQRQAPDGSWRLTLPTDWSSTGGQGKAIASAPSGGAGFLFSSFPIMPPRLGLPPTAIVSRYLPPQDSMRLIWQKFNNRDIRILASKPDPETAGQCVAQIGKRCEAADVQLSWVSPKGAACIGSFKVLNALPGFTGDWFSIVAGIWGPSDDMARYLPVLEKVAESFSINDRYAQGYIQQGMDNLRVLQSQTQHSINRLYEAIDDNQRDWERRSASQDRSAAGWSDYMRGNSYWISDLEGGKVYATDPWGTEDTSTHDRVEGAPYNYINFEGQNPRFPSENMREVNSYDLEHMQ